MRREEIETEWCDYLLARTSLQRSSSSMKFDITFLFQRQKDNTIFQCKAISNDVFPLNDRAANLNYATFVTQFLSRENLSVVENL